ncbi:MAG: hypothetical protein HYV35_12375 [Lentisphaerae bacterium]|nr:hypothetical protein [Lentisphaerota bacterium]
MTKKIITFLISCSLLSALRFSGPAWAEGILTVDNLIVAEDAAVYGELNVGYASATNGAAFATGGTITMSEGYRIHTFTDNGIFTVISGTLTCDVLVVAGGGGGGYGGGGGGGAGGLVYTQSVVGSGANTVIVGIGGRSVSTTNTPAKNGSNSVFGTITAFGGGGGGRGGNSVGHTSSDGANGGSGGGGGGYDSEDPNVGGSGTNGQGYSGGSNSLDGSYYGGGGGGGAGGAGGAGSGTAGGISGSGATNSISGSEVIYAVGGVGSGAAGGPGANATANTGNGGNGGSNGDNLGGDGGSGIVIVRYLISGYVPGLTITSDGINQTSASGTNIFMGKVGIGTDSPAEQLHVGGNVQVDGSLSLGGDPRSNWPSGADGALMVSNNLSEISSEADKAAARTNLGLGSAATSDTTAFDPAGAAAAVEAALSTHVADQNNPHQVTAVQVGALTPTGDGSGLTGLTASQVAGALIASNNLSDVADLATARNTLGALSVNGGTVSGAIILTAPAGDIPMGIYTNR